MTFVENFKPVVGSTPAANGYTSDYIHAGRCKTVGILVSMTQGNAAQATISINQATSAAAGGTKAITNAARIWSNLDVASSDSWVARTAAVSYQLDAGVANKLVYFEVDSDTLDLANGFCWLTCIVGASNAANISSVTYIFHDLRQQGNSAPTMIA